jgi:hypothetical protein
MDQRDERTRNPSRKVSYTQNTQRTLGAAPGNYAAAYFYSTADRGISFSLSDLADANGGGVMRLPPFRNPLAYYIRVDIVPSDRSHETKGLNE